MQRWGKINLNFEMMVLMRKHKTLKSIACLCAVASMFTITAFASTNPISFKLTGDATPQYTAQNQKNDAEQTAYVTVTSKTGNGIVYMQVTNNTRNVIHTGTLTVQSSGRYTLRYTRYTDQGTPMCLKAWSPSSATVNGRWTS